MRCTCNFTLPFYWSLFLTVMNCLLALLITVAYWISEFPGFNFFTAYFIVQCVYGCCCILHTISEKVRDDQEFDYFFETILYGILIIIILFDWSAVHIIYDVPITEFQLFNHMVYISAIGHTMLAIFWGMAWFALCTTRNDPEYGQLLPQ